MTSADSERSSDPSGIAVSSSASGVAFPAKAVSSVNETTFNLSSTDGSVERGRPQGSPDNRGEGPQKKARSATPGEAGSRGVSASGRKVSKPPKPRGASGSRSISKDALAAHNRRMNSPAAGGGGEDEDRVPELPFASANGPYSRPMARTVADDAASVAGTVFYPMTTDTPPAGGDGDGPPDDDDDDGFGHGPGGCGPPDGSSGGPLGGPDEDIINFDDVLIQQNIQQNNTWVKQEQNNQWIINPDGSQLLETHEMLAQQRSGQAASAAARDS